MTPTLSYPSVVTRPYLQPSAEDLDPESTNVRVFRWLLTLGFPPAESAAAVRPDIFKIQPNTPRK